jgi:hypothetical protein
LQTCKQRSVGSTTFEVEVWDSVQKNRVLGPYSLKGKTGQNLLSWSQEFEIGSWVGGGGAGNPLVTPDTVAGPDGAPVADTLAFPPTASGQESYLSQDSGFVPVVGQNYVFSVWMRASGAQTAYIRLVQQTGENSKFSPALALTTSWKRFSVAIKPVSVGSGNLLVRINNIDFTAAVGAKAIFIWGAQLEKAPEPGPYLETLSVTAQGAWVQQEPLYVKGLTLGSTYNFRARVQIKNGGPPSDWAAFVPLVAGDSTAPNPSYNPTSSATVSGVIVQANPVSPPTDTNHYEFWVTSTGATPLSSTAPNLPQSNDGSVRLVLSDIDVYTLYIRAVDTSGNRQAWTSLGAYNSYGAVNLSRFATGPNLIANDGFESNIINGPVNTLLTGAGQWLADGWVAYGGSVGPQYFDDAILSGDIPRTGQWNGFCRLRQNKTIPADSVLYDGALIAPGDLSVLARNRTYQVRGGDYLYFGGYARWDSTATLPGTLNGRVYFQVVFYDSAGGTVTAVNSVQLSGNSGGYVYLDGSVSVPVGAAYAQFVCIVEIRNTSGSPFNTSTNLYIDARFDDVFLFKANRGSHATYRPLSNPLTGNDAGSNATINIAAFTMRSGGTDVSVNLGAVTILSYNTLYFIYYDDPDFVGGAVTYNATTSKETALIGENRFFVGSIQTPRAAAPDTIGNSDGGSGVQLGQLNIFSMSVSTTTGTSGSGSITNIANALDGDLTTFATVAATFTGTGGSAHLFLSGPPGITRRFSSVTLKIRARCLTNNTLANGNGVFNLWWGTGGVGGGFSVIAASQVASPNTFALQTFSVTLPAGVNISQVAVLAQATVVSGSTSGSTSADIFEAWIEALE